MSANDLPYQFCNIPADTGHITAGIHHETVFPLYVQMYFHFP